jgi:hypothetical protein
MSAPIIWVILPILSGGVLLLLRRWEKWISLTAFLIALLLALLALRLPIEEAIPIHLWAGIPSLDVRSSMIFLGARLTIDNSTRSILAFFYLALAIWYAGAVTLRRKSYLFAIGLGFVGLLSGGMAINPNIYAPFIFLMAAALCVPAFSPPGKMILPGTGRFISFQLLGMCLILLANLSILMATIQANPATDLIIPIFILGLGFAMVIPIFPFHAWLTMITGESIDFEKGLFILLLATANLLGLSALLTRFGNAAGIENLNPIFRTAGILMILFGGISNAFTRQMGRAFGFALLHQIGVALVAISLVATTNNAAQISGLFFAQFAPMCIALALWIFSLNILSPEAEKVTMADLNEKLRRFPFASTALLLSIFSLSGLPILASFPVYTLLWSEVAKSQPSLVLFGILGSFSLSIFGLRLLASLIQKTPGENAVFSENGAQIVLMVMGIGTLLIMGFAPHLYLTHMIELGNALNNPIP